MEFDMSTDGQDGQGCQGEAETFVMVRRPDGSSDFVGVYASRGIADQIGEHTAYMTNFTIAQADDFAGCVGDTQ